MIIYRGIKEVHNIKETALALGNFDGVHEGHKALISACVEKGSSHGLVPSVFTFSNHPSNVIAGKTVVKNIITFEEKADILFRLGVEYLFSFEFDDTIRTSTPESFCRHLLFESLKIREAFCGFNYRFGYKAQGNPDILTQMGKELGYSVTVLPPVAFEGTTISSTILRQAVTDGEMERYRLYTGRRYTLNGHVVEGRHFGKSMGFPTINLALDLSMVIPANGVYVTQTSVDGIVYDSITNVGNKPTVGTFEKNAETHIFNFDRDIYGKDVRVEFIKMLREEKVFGSIAELTAQIEFDCRSAKNYHRDH
jgi:riboflavin kinase / FMN adenylyltransferase